jgi:Protein of unknown function (DUF4065)
MIFESKKKLDEKDEKLRELVLFISDRCQGDETFGATKLNKLLFYADFLAYLNFAKSITGQAYFRLPKGPAPRRMIHVRDQMVEDGDLRVEEHEYFGFPQHRPIALRKADLCSFSAGEINMVEKVIEMHRGKTASEISEESHGFIGWKLANEKEDIPYPVALVGHRKLSGQDLEFGIGLQEFAASLLKSHATGNQDCAVGG